MTNSKNSANNRRKLLKSLAAGSGAIIAGKSLPDQWARPVVDSVLLPVHAQTSNGPIGATTNNAVVQIDNDTFFAKALRGMVGDAHAQPESFNFAYCITPVSETRANTAVLVTPGDNCPFFANLFTLDNVEINTGPQVMVFEQDMCGLLQGGDAAGWIDSIGLINKARASIPAATIELTIIQGQATGTFNYQSGYVVDDFSFSSACPSFDVECCR